MPLTVQQGLAYAAGTISVDSELNLDRDATARAGLARGAAALLVGDCVAAAKRVVTMCLKAVERALAPLSHQRVKRHPAVLRRAPSTWRGLSKGLLKRLIKYSP